MKTLVVFLAASAVCFGYVNANPYNYRKDNANIQFLVNVNSANVNNLAKVPVPWVTPGTDIMAGVIAAMDSWNSITTANIHFATPRITTLFGDSSTTTNIISFDSGPEAAQLLNGSAIAVTDRVYDPATGIIIKSDIVFSTLDQFSSTGVLTAFDLQAILTHELGHCLGSSHTGVLSGSMFQATDAGLTNQAHLKADDIAFATALYPVGNSYGTITGTMRDTTGKALRGALISAQDPVNGQMIGGFSSSLDGTFSFSVPPGDYYVSAEPLNGQVQVGNVYLTAADVDANWQPVIAGGFAAPTTFHVTAGQPVSVTLSAPVGTSPIEITYSGAPATLSGTLPLYSGPTNIPAGQTTNFVFIATGLSPSVAETDFKMIGPVQIVPGSFKILSRNQHVYELILSAPLITTLTTSTLLISNNGATAAYSGGIVVQPAAASFPPNGVGNAFSFASAAVAPGEIVALFGTNLGPASGLFGSFTQSGYVTDQLEGISVRFDGIPAPLFYSGAGQINVQVPYEVAGKQSTNIVVDTGIESASVSIPVQAAVPGLFPSAVLLNGTVNSAANPVKAGDYVVLYATGLGSPVMANDTGQAAPTADASASAITVNYGGVSMTPAYAGVTPGLAGLDQINLQIPTGSGEVSVFVTAASGAQSQTISIWVK